MVPAGKPKSVTSGPGSRKTEDDDEVDVSLPFRMSELDDPDRDSGDDSDIADADLTEDALHVSQMLLI